MSKPIKDFFEGAFQDMADSARAQHVVDRANCEAVKAEGKADIEEARANASPKVFQAKMQAERDEQLAQAKQRIIDAEERIDEAKFIQSK